MRDVWTEKVAIVIGAGSIAPGWGNGKAISVLFARAGAELEPHLSSVGYPQAVVKVRIAAADGGDPVPYEPGEILVRGDTVTRGYWGDETATRQTIVDGWLWTGDVGSFDTTGLLTLRNRSKDVIISGSSNIYPREVEEALLHHPAIAEVPVLGRRLRSGARRLWTPRHSRPASARPNSTPCVLPALRVSIA